MKFLDGAPRFLFFTGKGGVGKTSIACASAVALTREGKKVLLVSTDPASNVGQVFGLSIGNTITDVPAVPGLSALEIDPEQAADAYRERIIGPVRGLLPEKELASITEQLSGSCTTEIASFNEFTALLTDETTIAGFDHVLFDTAPTGHTIRLLQLPGSWTDFLDDGKGDASCLGPLSGLEKQRTIYAGAVAALSDPQRTRLVLVARPQRSPLAEIARTHTELADIGLTEQHVVINGVLPAPDGDDELAAAIYDREQAALAALPADLRKLPIDRVELKATNMVGVDALDTLFIAESSTAAAQQDSVSAATVPDASLSALVDELAADDHGLIMCMGKGGVGKTTIAAALAVALAERGHQVLLTTTDPSAHLTDTLGGSLENLNVSRIDPAEATAAYRDRVLTSKGAALDEQGRANLAEDLKSPCTEEVAVFQAFSRVIHESRRHFVVVDTAPTGHTLLLLDATGSYHREIARQMGENTNFTTPLMRLQNPDETKILIVTLAETTPRLEAEGLHADLERAGIRPWAWVVNNSIAAAQLTSPLLQERAAAELVEIGEIARQQGRYAIVPMLPAEPVGVEALSSLARNGPTASPLS
ncbi:arsenical pump-driving ATPase [Rhodococcus sp. ABRD24]|uniref:arsenical pump-driving ATPase n=1 Tax=Rhodococcus sp. ABRD24 TaxID=2507582 RepID=UPI00103D0141|nr:arsenical pump-driving ATPase [Rhodococcus sp. ABRD24]QBJ96195.1 arsenical pump-driving ATPase [Rhodococcus sp. ABRD24]